jgi:hypothetical protein
MRLFIMAHDKMRGIGLGIIEEASEERALKFLGTL